MIDRHQDDDCTDILHKVDSEVKWVPYDQSKSSNVYEKVHYDTASDVSYVSNQGITHMQELPGNCISKDS